MRSCKILFRMALAGLLLLSCGRDSPEAPTARYTLSGHVKLTGYLVDVNSQFRGTKVVGDADGIPVELLYGTTVIQRTTTVKGVYHFTGLAPGGYQTRTSVIGNVADVTEPLTVPNGDLDVVDTLRLASLGDLRPVPNPFATVTDVYFLAPDTQSVALTVLDLGTVPIASLTTDTVYTGFRLATWNGLDHNSQRVTPGIYWVTLTGTGDDYRAQLVFLEPSTPLAVARETAVLERRRRAIAGGALTPTLTATPRDRVRDRSAATAPGR